MESLKLLKDKKFGPFFWTQFFGAFNDNVFKNALVVLMTIRLSESEGPIMVNIAAGIFILPFFILSAFSGQVCDKVEKSQLIRKIKIAEIIIMTLGAVGFYFENFYFLLFVLFAMGAQSTFFGPVKYSILPQQLNKDELVSGNAAIQMGTFLSILIGTIVGGVLAGSPFAGVCVFLFALIGYFTARGIPEGAPNDPHLQPSWNPIPETIKLAKYIYSNEILFFSVTAISWFWFYGGFVLAQFPPLTNNVLKADQYVITLLLGIFSVGIGIGSLLCEKVSKRKIELGVVPLGCLGLTLFSYDLFLAAQAFEGQTATLKIGEFLSLGKSYRIIFDIFMMSFSGGFFIVPLYALMQLRSEPSHVSRVIAGNNIYNSVLMVLSAVFAIVLLSLGCTIPELFKWVAILNLVVFCYILVKIPQFIIRLFQKGVGKILFDVERGHGNSIPDSGGAILACRPTDLKNLFALSLLSDRPIKFFIDSEGGNRKIPKPILKLNNTVSLNYRGNEEEFISKYLEKISDSLKAEELICFCLSDRPERYQRYRNLFLKLSEDLDFDPPVFDISINNSDLDTKVDSSSLSNKQKVSVEVEEIQNIQSQDLVQKLTIFYTSISKNSDIN